MKIWAVMRKCAALLRGDEAEVIALRVGHHDISPGLSNHDGPGSHEPCAFGNDVGDTDIEMDASLHAAAVHFVEAQCGPRAIDHHYRIGLRGAPQACEPRDLGIVIRAQCISRKHAGPEAGQHRRVAAIEHDFLEGPGQRDLPGGKGRPRRTGDQPLMPADSVMACVTFFWKMR